MGVPGRGAKVATCKVHMRSRLLFQVGAEAGHTGFK